MLSGVKKRDKADMRRIGKSGLMKKTSDILRSNDGASIVMVTIIAVIIVAGVIILSINSSTLLAFADRQYAKDQAYEAATTMGMALDEHISKGGINLASHDGEVIVSDSSNNISVTAVVDCIATDTYVVSVTAHSRGSEYVFTATYTGAGTTYMRVA